LLKSKVEGVQKWIEMSNGENAGGDSIF